MSRMPERVVILGASGFLGRALHARLEGDGVAVVAHSSRTLDLTRADALAVLDGVVGPDTALVFASALTPDPDECAFGKRAPGVVPVFIADLRTDPVRHPPAQVVERKLVLNLR